MSTKKITNGMSVPINSRTLEHLIPRSKGGVTSVKNCALSCATCNNLKSSLTHDQFLYARKHGLLEQYLKEIREDVIFKDRIRYLSKFVYI